MALYTDTFKIKLGQAACVVSELGALIELRLVSEYDPRHHLELRCSRKYELTGDRERCAFVKAQLEEYLTGKRTKFNMQLDPTGTGYQHSVWEQLKKIPFGKTVHYSDVAGMMGKPNHARAVGQAVAANPIMLIVPCHRVLGKDNRLRGYAGGLEMKRKLLVHEGAIPAQLFD